MSTEGGSVSRSEVVCVTGGSGYIGSWLVCLLLRRGYIVHTTVKDLSSSHLHLRFLVLSHWSCSLILFYILIFIYLYVNAEDEKETKHLEALEGADSRLRLFQMDLLDYESIVAAVKGAVGLFHLASPCIVDQVHDPKVSSAVLHAPL